MKDPVILSAVRTPVGRYLGALKTVEADIKDLGLGSKDYERINVNGSGISLGHPIACTGTRILATLLHEMKRRDVRLGLACICGGGGLGIAAVFERK